MGEGKPGPSRGGRPGIVLVVALIGVGTVAALNPSTASACSTVTNPDGSKTCTSDPYTDPCDAGATYIVDYIPLDATITGHQLTNNPACPNSTIVENSFEDNVTGYSPPAGHRAVKVTYTITCNSPPCTGSTQTTLEVDYTQPSGGGGGGGGPSGGGSTAPPPAGAVDMPKTHPVDPKTGRAVIEFQLGGDDDVLNQTYDLTEVLMFFVGGAVPKSTASAATATAGAIADAHHAAGETTIRTTLKLNGKGRKALRAKGKLRVTMRGVLRNSAGSTPFSGTLKLVAKKSKK